MEDIVLLILRYVTLKSIVPFWRWEGGGGSGNLFLGKCQLHLLFFLTWRSTSAAYTANTRKFRCSIICLLVTEKVFCFLTTLILFNLSTSINSCKCSILASSFLFVSVNSSSQARHRNHCWLDQKNYHQLHFWPNCNKRHNFVKSVRRELYWWFVC